MRSAGRAPRPLLGRRRVELQCVDLAAHRAAERAVDELVALQRAQARELRGDDERREVHAVVGLDSDRRSGQRGLDLLADLGGDMADPWCRA